MDLRRARTPRPAAPCRSCGTRPTHDGARFCGHCGSGLTGRTGGVHDIGGTRATPSAGGSAGPSPDGSRPGRRRLGEVLIGVVLLAAALAYGGPRALGVAGGLADGVAGGVAGGAPTLERDDAVELGPDSLAGGTPARSGGTPTEPDGTPEEPAVSDAGTRLGCDPVGCHAWKLDVPTGRMAGAAGVVYLLGDDGLTIRDGRFAEARYVADLRDLIRVTDDGDAISSLTDPLRPAVVRADAGGAMVVTPDLVARVDRLGGRRWTSGVAGWHVWDAATVADEYVVLRARSPRGGGPFERVSVLDLADGSERWSREVIEVYGLSGDLLFVAGGGGRIEALELGDGRVRLEQPLPDGTQVRVLGPLVHLGSRLPPPAPRSRLVDAATGTTPDDLDAPALRLPIRVGTRIVALLGDLDADGVVAVVAMEEDGSPAWRREMPVPAGSGQQPSDARVGIALRDLRDGSGIDLEMGATRTVLSVADGSVLTRGPRDHIGREHDWHTLSDDGIAIRHLDGVLQVRGRRGTIVRVSGDAPEVVSTDPVVVLDGDRALGLRVGSPD